MAQIEGERIDDNVDSYDVTLRNISGSMAPRSVGISRSASVALDRGQGRWYDSGDRAYTAPVAGLPLSVDAAASLTHNLPLNSASSP